MKGCINKLILLIILVFISKHSAFSQYISKVNHKGNWESSSTWNPVWLNPQTNISGINVSINGYVTVNGPLTFGGNAGNLIINDTLVIKGDLTLGDHNDLLINNFGILVVWGNLNIVRRADIATNGYLIVVKDIIKTGQSDEGSLTYNQNPAKVFIGGSVPPELTNNNPKYTALNCSQPNAYAYPNSSCSYGNLTDLESTPVFDFYRSTCSLSAPTVSASGPVSFCSGGNVILTSSSGTSYLWSDGSTSQNITVTSSGSYSVKVTDTNRCLSTSSETVVVIAKPTPAKPVISPSGPVELCPGENISLTSSTVSGNVWTTGATTQSINIGNSGAYQVKVTLNGCESEYSEPVQVTLKQAPATPSISPSGPLTFCKGDSVELTASNAYSYAWSSGATTKSIKVKEPGNFTVTVTNEDGCTSAASTLTEVTVLPLPGKPTVTYSAPLMFCAGDSVLLSSGSAAGYEWSTGSTAQTIKVKSSGEYKVRVTDENGCRSLFSDVVQVVAHPLPAKPSISASGDLTLCNGDTLSLETLEATGYLWSNGTQTKSIKAFLPGEYRVKVTDANGCESSFSDAINVTVHPNPAKSVITASGPLTFCSGDSVILTSGSGDKYLWSTGATSQTIVVYDSGTFSVKVTDKNGCESDHSEEVAAVVKPMPLKPVITASGPLNFCIGDSVSLTTETSSEYLWSTGENTPIITAKSAGKYSVQVKNSVGCLSEPSVEINVVVHPLPSVSISSRETMCVNGSMEVKGIPDGGSFKVSDKSAALRNNLLTPTLPGILTLEYTYSGVCTNTATKNIVVTGSPIVNAGPDQELTGNQTRMQAELSPGEQGEWILISGKAKIHNIHLPSTQITELGEGKNIFQWKVSNGNCDAMDEVMVSVGDLFIPSVITPNGDGENDYFYIDPEYGELKVIIFNKWGKVEYTAENYLNNWNGINNKGVELPDDTYFYVLHFTNGIIKKGSLLIKR